MRLNAYLHFDGQCREAFDFYAKTLGGKIVATMSYGEMPGQKPDPQMKDKILYTRLDADGNVLMGSDAPPQYKAKPQGFSLSLGVDTPEKAERLFRDLSTGGSVNQPMMETFFAHRFGMAVDKFGIPWMVICEKPMSQ